MEPVTVADPKFWKWEDQRLDATLGKRPTISVFTRRSGTSQIDQSFWYILTKVMGSSMGEIIQAQKIQQQPTVTPIAQAGNREFYSDWALAALMGYAQVYNIMPVGNELEIAIVLRIDAAMVTLSSWKCPKQLDTITVR